MTKITETRGRPELPDDERRSVVVQFRCTPREKEYLIAAAQSADEKLSDWLRERAISSLANDQVSGDCL